MIKEIKEKKVLLLEPALLILLAILAVSKLSFRPPAPPDTSSVKGIQYAAKLSATVGEHFLTLSGWTSPSAKVTLSSSANSLYGQTTADETGFFIFKFIFLPYKIGELALLAKDVKGFSSPPLYLPEPPTGQDLFIENVLMPPTLSLSSGLINYQQTVSASGKTFPNSKVVIYLYSAPKTTLWKIIQETIIKSVFAKTAPKLEIESDENGNFEFNLPSVEPADEKLFVASFFSKPEISEKNYSPKSFTLSFETLSFWEKIAYFLLLLLGKIYLWFRGISAEPTKIIVLEIPLMIFLFAKLIFRKYAEKAIGT